jgi:N-acetylmuramoyl-L-alanine amidase
VNRRPARVLIVVLAAVAVLVIVSAISFPRSPRYEISGRIVILDPGHFETPDDTGALNLIDDIWLEERDVNWEVTHATRQRLVEHGIIVIMTRQENEYISRSDRYLIANESGGEVLLSIHHNGTIDHRINYTTTFYTHESDIGIARRAQNQLVELLGFNDSGIRRETFGMTVHPSMPAALTEAWFITHDATASRYLAESAARTSYVPGVGWPDGSLVSLEAEALANAIISWLESNPPPDHS